MDFWTVVAMLYALSVIVALRLTYREQRQSRYGHTIYVFMGYACCTVWPLVAVFMIVLQCSMKQDRVSRNGSTDTPAWLGRS